VKPISVHLLQTMLQHRTVDLVKEFRIDDHLIVRTDPHEIAIVGGVVDLAQSNPVGNHGITIRFGITDDMSCIKQLSMPQSAHCARSRVRIQNLLSKDWLMQPTPRLLHYIPLFGSRERRKVTANL
jgi:hypothetical protein